MKSAQIVFYVFAAIFMLVLGFVIRVYLLIPNREDLLSCFTTKMHNVYLCPQSKNYVPLNQISKVMQKTVILTEDSRFYEHKGFDWESIEKSAKENLEGGRYKRGGSTITQQLAKNLYLTKDKTIVRKIIEACITFQIEKYLTKREILEKYLNVVEFGKDIYGIKPAAWHYFKKSPGQLDAMESAFLAMLLPSPQKYSKSFYTKKLTPFVFRRIKQIIRDMYQYDRINEDQYIVAKDRLREFFSTPEQLAEINDMDTMDSSDSMMFEGADESADSDVDMSVEQTDAVSEQDQEI